PSCRAARGAPRAACEYGHSHPSIILRAVDVRLRPVPRPRHESAGSEGGSRLEGGRGAAGPLNCLNLSPILLESLRRGKSRQRLENNSKKPRRAGRSLKGGIDESFE